jgi:hypothetical protein
MLVNSVYLVIHSHSLLKSPKDKPSFRVATTELPNLPTRWTGHDHVNHKYIDVLVTASGTTLAEEWKIELQYSRNVDQDLEIVAWFNDLEAAEKKLTDNVLHDCNAQQDTDEESNTEKKVRVTWKDSLTGNSMAHYRIKSNQETPDGSMSQITTSHWYEIIRIDLEHTDVYDAKWHEHARLSYLETSKRINFLLIKMRNGGLSELELDELDGLRRGLGYVEVKDTLKGIGEYVRRAEEEGEGVGEYLQNEIVDYSSEDEEDKRIRKREMDKGTLDVNDPEVMGMEEGGDDL